jgi:hypothetical protein
MRIGSNKSIGNVFFFFTVFDILFPRCRNHSDFVEKEKKKKKKKKKKKREKRRREMMMGDAEMPWSSPAHDDPQQDALRMCPSSSPKLQNRGRRRKKTARWRKS